MVSASLVSTRDPGPVLELSRVRDQFLAGANEDLSAIRPLVARSWYRSRAAGVVPAHDRGVATEGRVDALTLRVAEPLLGELDDMVADCGGYVSLTAPNGALVNPGFLRSSEGFPDGYSLLEEHCGSNGEGLALEEGRGVWLAPEEHVRVDMRSNWCFASLVRDPFHSRIRAVVGLTFPSDRLDSLDPASTLLMLEGIAARIGREIEAASSVKERVLLREYITVARRRGGAAVIAMDGKNSLMNSAATHSLGEGDIAVITGMAKSVMASANGTSCQVKLEGPGTVTMDVSPVHLTKSRVGAIVVLRPPAGLGDPDDDMSHACETSSASVGEAPPIELDGVSAEFQRTASLMHKAVAQGRSVSLVGEPGTGKRRMAMAFARGVGEVSRIDCEPVAYEGSSSTTGFGSLITDSLDALVLENADALGKAKAAELAALLKEHSRVRVFMTVARPTEGTQLLTEAGDMLEVAVAPLRSRREDIPVLARAFARQYGDKSLSRRLITTLTNSDWPNNIDQLRTVVSNAIERAKGSEVTVDDLPEGFHRAMTRGRLSRLEDAELGELRRALQEAQGNRRYAAELLGIGRSTLYRRMDYFRGRGIDL